jgi:hypothetical protein
MKVVNIPSTKKVKKLVRRVNTGTRDFAEQSDIGNYRCTFRVIASEAKQSTARHNGWMDRFVAALSCANASRLSHAMTALTPA